MTALVSVLTVVLLAVAALHILWGIGFWWPIRQEARLVAAVVGLQGTDRMPGAVPCALVAVALMASAWWLWLPLGLLRQAGLGVIAAVFLLRGALPLTALWRRATPQQPFARLDRQVYGPVCVGVGLAFGVIFFNGM